MTPLLWQKVKEELKSPPLSMGFSRQKYWSGLPFPSPGGLRDSMIKPASLVSPALAGRFLPTSATWEMEGLP